MTVLVRSLGVTCLLLLASHIGAAQTRTLQYVPRKKRATVAWQQTTRAALTTLLGLDDLTAMRTQLSFDATESLSCDMGSYTLYLRSICSTPGRMIQIALTVPKGIRVKAPAVVCIGGHGSELLTTYTNGQAFGPFPAYNGDWATVYKGFAARLAESGYVTIATVVSQHVVYESGRLLMGERLWDLMRCVDYLESLRFVDQRRIGCAGLSLGGEMAMWLGALDTRIAAEVSAGWLTMFSHLNHPTHCQCWNFPGLLELVEIPDIFGLTAPKPVLCQNGVLEPPQDFSPELAQIALEQIIPVYKAFRRPDNIQLDIHNGGHEIDLPALLAFFETKLKRGK